MLFFVFVKFNECYPLFSNYKGYKDTGNNLQHKSILTFFDLVTVWLGLSQSLSPVLLSVCSDKRLSFAYTFHLPFPFRLTPHEDTSISFLLRNGTLKMMKYVFDAAFRIGSRPHKNALCQVSASNYCRSIPRKDLKDFLLFSYRKTIEIC